MLVSAEPQKCSRFRVFLSAVLELGQHLPSDWAKGILSSKPPCGRTRLMINFDQVTEYDKFAPSFGGASREKSIMG